MAGWPASHPADLADGERDKLGVTKATGGPLLKLSPRGQCLRAPDPQVTLADNYPAFGWWGLAKLRARNEPTPVEFVANSSQLRAPARSFRG